MNRSIKDALVAEEKFFRSRPVRKFLFVVNSQVLLLIHAYSSIYVIHRYTVVWQIVVVFLN